MAKEPPTLRWLASRAEPLNAKQLDQIQAWLDADWESHDVDRDAVRLISRLVNALRDKVR